MKLLIDNALSPTIAEGLSNAGYDAVHVRDLGMQSATDEQIFLHSEEEERVIISADTDFGALLALRKKARPSFILIRKNLDTRLYQILELLCDVLPKLEEDLAQGAVVTITDERIRIRKLPISY